MIKTKERYKFNILNVLGIEEAWTGVFDSQILAYKWYSIHGKFFEGLGYNLVMKTTESVQV